MTSNQTHRLISAGELVLFGPVGMGFENEGFTDSEVVEALSQMVGDITVLLNSGGGSAYQGLAIYNALEGYKRNSGKVTICIEALAASSASLIAMAGDEVVMKTGAMMMIHDPSSISIGTARDHELSAQQLDKLSDSAAGIYAQKAGVKISKVKTIMEAETWFSASQTVRAGFADRDEGVATKAAPKFEYAEHYANTPTQILASMAGDFPLGSMTNKRKKTMNTKTKKQVVTEPDDGVVMTGTGLLTHAKARAEACGLNESQTAAVMTAVGNMKPGATDGDVSKEIIALMATPSDAPTLSSVSMDTLENPEFSDGALQDAITARLENRRLNDQEPGSHFQDMQIPEMMVDRAKRGGVPENDLRGSRGMKRAMNFRAATMSGGGYGSDDFPGILAPVIEKVALNATQVFISEISQLAVPHNWNGYNKSRFISGSGMDDLPENNEHAPIEFISIGEDFEEAEAGVNAGQISISEKLLRGDTIGVLQGQINNSGRAAAGVINKKMRAAILGSEGTGAKLRDGNFLFDASRNNIATGGDVSGLTQTSLGEAEKFILKQKIGDEKEPAGFKPKYVLVGPELKIVAQRLLADITPSKSDEVNPFANALELLVDPTIEDISWRIFADKSQAQVLVSGYMDGAKGPQVDVEESFDVLGMKFRIVVRYGAALAGYRGCYMNPGE
ncbi:MAG: Clp protease ClpP [Rhizobiaceae bacterium]|nr:Clp protease ClpP [Rhizobiaceae bacterium]